MIIIRNLLVIASFLILWQLIIFAFNFPPYILPSPLLVFKTLIQQLPLIAEQSVTTITETILGLFLATLLGCSIAISMLIFRPLRFWFIPVLLISQALPTFAIAPLFVIWFGYGMASKIAITLLMLFFPIASAFYDGLQRTPHGWLDLAKTMNAKSWSTLWQIRIPAALPALATGLRVAAAIAPIGAIIGEWVGSSAGLGFLMLNANARMQIDLVFAVLLVIIVFSLVLFYSVDSLLRHAIPWQAET